MAGKTHSRHIDISLGGVQIECSINNLGGVGLAYDQADVTTFCNSIKEAITGNADVTINLSGPFNNTAVTGGHIVVEPLNGDDTGAVLVIEIGVGAAPTTGDAKFTVTNAIVSNYLVAAGNGPVTWSAALKPAVGATAVWGTI